jgi:hypothetical protein
MVKKKRCVLTEEKLDKTEARYESTSQKTMTLCTPERRLESVTSKSCFNFGHTSQPQFMFCNHESRLAELISATGFCRQLMPVKVALI